jgi:hypothetical protein
VGWIRVKARRPKANAPRWVLSDVVMEDITGDMGKSCGTIFKMCIIVVRNKSRER